MSVILEGISVVVRRSTIGEKYEGGLEKYRVDCPNNTFCADEHVARVGFMTPANVGVFIQRLEQAGLVFNENGQAIEIAVVDQITGPTLPCDWLIYQRTEQGVMACALAGVEPGAIVAPAGWTYETSLSATGRRVPSRDTADQLEFVRHEEHHDVY